MDEETKNKLSSLLEQREEKKLSQTTEAEREAGLNEEFVKLFDEAIDVIVRPEMEEYSIYLESQGVQVDITDMHLGTINASITISLSLDADKDFKRPRGTITVFTRPGNRTVDIKKYANTDQPNGITESGESINLNNLTRNRISNHIMQVIEKIMS